MRVWPVASTSSAFRCGVFARAGVMCCPTHLGLMRTALNIIFAGILAGHNAYIWTDFELNLSARFHNTPIVLKRTVTIYINYIHDFKYRFQINLFLGSWRWITEYSARTRQKLLANNTKCIAARQPRLVAIQCIWPFDTTQSITLNLVPVRRKF